ncbi:MAG TPA: ABC transporter transmembrane domain-containing protein, partial [Gaiellaceae bacterium]|nr:ABC transporter transmembrane domain-containing protein [Gaiellaceae bacterium]
MAMRFRMGVEEKPVRPADRAVRRANLRRVGGLFRGYRLRLGTVLVLIGISALLGVVSPFLLREVFDRAIPDDDLTLLTWLVAGMIAIAVVSQVLGVAQTWLSNVVGQEVMHDLRAAVYR